MLVKFETTTLGGITMFGDVAIRLLKLMGHSGTVPSAIMPEDIPQALQRLRTGISGEEAVTTAEPTTELENDEDGQFVSLKVRAFPLIELLEAAEKEHVPVMWNDQMTSNKTNQAG